MINKELDKFILEILEQGSSSEYELINKLQRPPYDFFSPDIFQTELALFQTHFVVHNALYRLRDFGLAHSLFDIDTLTTKIMLVPIVKNNGTSVCEQTRPEIIKLREYYLDWSNFHKTQAEDVSELLTNFWCRYSKVRTGLNDQNEIDGALKTLEFDCLPTYKELKTQYKKLSMRYHPDKGGCHQKFHELYDSYQVLILEIKSKKSFDK